MGGARQWGESAAGGGGYVLGFPGWLFAHLPWRGLSPLVPQTRGLCPGLSPASQRVLPVDLAQHRAHGESTTNRSSCVITEHRHVDREQPGSCVLPRAQGRSLQSRQGPQGPQRNQAACRVHALWPGPSLPQPVGGDSLRRGCGEGASGMFSGRYAPGAAHPVVSPPVCPAACWCFQPPCPQVVGLLDWDLAALGAGEVPCRRVWSARPSAISHTSWLHACQRKCSVAWGRSS